MKIIAAESMGFCFGVKRAIKLARDISGKTDEKVYTFGPIIHNPQVVQELKEEGIIPVNNLEEIDIGYIVIRSHGIDPSVLNEIKEKGLKIVDATCPLVKKAQERARELVKEGYDVIILGEKDHPEVKGLMGYTGGKARVVEGSSDFGVENESRVGIVAQTTQSMDSFKNIVDRLIPEVSELKVFNTICGVTEERQEEVRKLAEIGDLVIVIGGKRSANTSRLAAISKEKGCETYHIETEQEIKKEWFKKKKIVGVTAGASTPDWIIKKVLKKLREMNV